MTECEPTTPVAFFHKHSGKPMPKSIRCPNCGEKMVAAKADGESYYFHKFIYGKDKE